MQTIYSKLSAAAILALGASLAMAQATQAPAMGSPATPGAPATMAPASPAAPATQAKDDQPVTDTWITTKVKAELATTQGVPSTDISVETTKGVVTLTGVLPDSAAVKKAEAAAKSVKGVKKVDAAGLKAKG